MEETCCLSFSAYIHTFLSISTVMFSLKQKHLIPTCPAASFVWNLGLFFSLPTFSKLNKPTLMLQSKERLTAQQKTAKRQLERTWRSVLNPIASWGTDSYNCDPQQTAQRSNPLLSSHMDMNTRAAGELCKITLVILH